MKFNKTLINNSLEAATGIRLIKVRPREFIVELKKLFGDKKLIGAEVGTFEGVTSKQILKNLNIERLYLIDKYGEEKKFKDAFKKAERNIKGSKERVEWLIGYSNVVFKNIKEELDFAYIDADHRYKGVKEDIENFYPLIKKGGMLAGDDFWNVEGYGVIQAVIEFVNKHNLNLFVSHNRWWIIK